MDARLAEHQGERNYIMQVVCEATQSQSSTVQVGAFECLVRIMGLYYEKMEFYMERALFGLTIMGMKHHDEPVALQAIEFWSTVCEEEIDLTTEATEVSTSTPSCPCLTSGRPVWRGASHGVERIRQDGFARNSARPSPALV